MSTLNAACWMPNAGWMWEKRRRQQSTTTTTTTSIYLAHIPPSVSLAHDPGNWTVLVSSEVIVLVLYRRIGPLEPKKPSALHGTNRCPMQGANMERPIHRPLPNELPLVQLEASSASRRRSEGMHIISCTISSAVPSDDHAMRDPEQRLRGVEASRRRAGQDSRGKATFHASQDRSDNRRIAGQHQLAMVYRDDGRCSPTMASRGQWQCCF